MSLESDALRQMLASLRETYEKRLKKLEDRVADIEADLAVAQEIERENRKGS